MAAKCMGHDIAVHHRTYHRWIDQADIAAAARNSLASAHSVRNNLTNVPVHVLPKHRPCMSPIIIWPIGISAREAHHQPDLESGWQPVRAKLYEVLKILTLPIGDPAK